LDKIADSVSIDGGQESIAGALGDNIGTLLVRVLIQKELAPAALVQGC
jgi:hypothetical protein